MHAIVSAAAASLTITPFSSPFMAHSSFVTALMTLLTTPQALPRETVPDGRALAALAAESSVRGLQQAWHKAFAGKVAVCLHVSDLRSIDESPAEQIESEEGFSIFQDLVADLDEMSGFD